MVTGRGGDKLRDCHHDVTSRGTATSKVGRAAVNSWLLVVDVVAVCRFPVEPADSRFEVTVKMGEKRQGR